MAKKGIGDYQIRKEKTSEMKILKVLSDGKPHRYEELKQKTGLSSATLSKHLKELEKGSIIEKHIDLESGEYPYPVFYRLNSLIFEKISSAYTPIFWKAEPIKPEFTEKFRLPRYDLHLLHSLCGLITLDFLQLWIKDPEAKEEFFNRAFEVFVIERYKDTVSLLKQKLLALKERGENVEELLEKELECYKNDYDFMLKKIAKKDRTRKENGANHKLL